MSISTEITRIQSAKSSLKAAINAKGGALTNELLGSYAAAVTALPSGTDISDTTAAAGDVRSGKAFYAANGTKTNGTLSITASKILKGQSIGGVSGTATQDANASAADIASGKTAYVNGAKLTGTSSAKNVYKCSSVNLDTRTWIGKLVTTDPVTGVDSVAVNTTALSWSLAPVPEVGKLYTGDGLTEVSANSGAGRNGMVFYAALHKSKSKAETGQFLTEIGDVSFEDAGGLSAFYNEGGVNYISFPDSGFPSGGSDRTVSCMFRANTISPETSRIFYYGTPSLTHAMILNTGWNDKFGVEYYGDELSSNEIQTGRWYHVAVTLSNGTTSVYIDGSFVRSGNMTANTILSETGYIGHLGGQNYDGAICEVKVWNRALSNSEISAESARCRGLIDA